MQRTLTIVLVPALLFLALAIMALEPRDEQSDQSSGTAKKQQRQSDAPAAQAKGNDSTRPTTKDATSKDATDGKKADDKESLARTFGRLMRNERALKGFDERKVAKRSAPGAKGARTETSNTVVPAVSTQQGVVTNSASVLPTIVARVPGDLAKLDQKVPVERLTITGDQFTNRSLRELAGMRILSLSIEAVNISDAGLVHLTKLAALRDLRLWTPGVSDQGLAHLAQLPELQLLDLEGTHVRGTGLAYLSDLGELKHLTLGSLTEDSDVAQLKSLPALRELDLRSCQQLTDTCVVILAELSQLESVWLPPQVGVADKLAVRQSLSPCTVRW